MVHIRLTPHTANVDRTLILLEHQQSTPRSFQNLDYLEDARDRLLDLIPNHADFEAEASRLWNSVKSQDGFVLAARLLYRKASSRNKGSDYFAAHEYVVTAMSTVAAAGGLVSLPLHEIWLQIHYHWRVVRKTVVGVSGSINWNRLDQVATVLAAQAGVLMLSTSTSTSKGFRLLISTSGERATSRLPRFADWAYRAVSYTRLATNYSFQMEDRPPFKDKSLTGQRITFFGCLNSEQIYVLGPTQAGQGQAK